MVMRVTFSGSQQIIEELCEHCNEFVNEIHISEITTKRETDPRTIRISSSDAVIEVKPKSDRIEEIKKERFNAKMLTSSVDDEGAAVTESLKYELRSEKMCSSSANEEDAEFCYRTENTKFLQKTTFGTAPNSCPKVCAPVAPVYLTTENPAVELADTVA